MFRKRDKNSINYVCVKNDDTKICYKNYTFQIHFIIISALFFFNYGVMELKCKYMGKEINLHNQ